MRPRSLRPKSRFLESLWKSPASPLALAALSCLAGWDIPGAWAKPLTHSLPKKVKKTAGSSPEVYAAIENSGSLPDQESMAEVLPAPKSPRAEPKASFKAPPFDSVPTEHRASIAKRLALIEGLLLEHGRAYDYRTLTLAQLQALVDHLGGSKAQASPEAKPVSRPPTPTLAAPLKAPSLSDELHGAPEKTLEAATGNSENPSAPEEATAESYAVTEGDEAENLIPAPSLSE